MNFKIKTISNFEKEAKRLFKKYRSLKSDLETIFESLSENPRQGIPLGKNCLNYESQLLQKEKEVQVAGD